MHFTLNLQKILYIVAVNSNNRKRTFMLFDKNVEQELLQ